MSTRLVFRCRFCDAQPDSETQRSLERQLSLLMFGTYVDAEPANWLVWQGRGPYGPTEYACAEHRESLKAYLRTHYGAIGSHPFAAGPHPAGWLRREDLARTRRRRAMMTYKRWGPSR